MLLLNFRLQLFLFQMFSGVDPFLLLTNLTLFIKHIETSYYKKKQIYMRNSLNCHFYRFLNMLACLDIYIHLQYSCFLIVSTNFSKIDNRKQ